jgi:hypothetical protein
MFIGSNKASYIIGASLAVDGGMIVDRGLQLWRGKRQARSLINGSNDVIIYTINSAGARDAEAADESLRHLFLYSIIVRSVSMAP